MKLSPSLNDAFCEQISIEYHNQLIYAQIASYFEDLQLKKISEYFRKQSDDEKSHADKFIAHINDRIGGEVSLASISSPVSTQGMKILDIANIYVQTEESTTESIESLYDMAVDEKSFIDLPFLLDMLREQIDEEQSAQEFSMRILAIKDIYLLDEVF